MSRSLAEDPANIYSLLPVAGYLKTPKKELQGDGAWLCEEGVTQIIKFGIAFSGEKVKIRTE